MDVTAVVAVTLFTIIFFVGVPGNCLVIWVFARKTRKNSTSYLILSLATIDLSACLIAPIHLLRSLGGVFINDFFCKSSIYGSRAFSFSALYLTTFIALDRFMAVCKPLEMRSSARKIIAAIVISIGLAVTGNLQFAVFVKPVQFGPVHKCVYRGGPEWLDLSNEIFTSISYLLALIICTCVYVRIYQEIRNQMKVRAGLVGNDIPISLHSERSGCSVSKPQEFLPAVDNPEADPKSARHDLLPHDAGGTATQSGSNVVDDRNSTCVQDALSNSDSGGIIPGSATKGSPPSKPLGNQQFLQVKVLNSMLSQDGPSADCSSYPESGDTSSAKRNGARPPQGNRQRKERIMTRMLLGTNLILMLSWMPSFILTNVPDDKVAAYRTKESQGIVVAFSYQLRTLNHIVSIFVYALLNANFRKDCKAIFTKCKR